MSGCGRTVRRCEAAMVVMVGLTLDTKVMREETQTNGGGKMSVEV